MPGPRRRRQFLALAPTVLVSVTGCMGKSNSQTPPSPVTTSTDRAPSLTWHRTLDAAPIGTVHAHQNTVYAADYASLYAFDAATGADRWQFDIDEEQPTDTTCYGQTFALQERPTTLYTGGCEAVHAIDAETGETRWSNEAYTTNRTPALTDSRVYLASETVVGLSTATGQKNWQVATATSTAPTVGGGKVFVGTPDGTLHAIDVQTTTEDWTFQTGDKQISTPALADDGSVVVGSGTPTEAGHLSALDPTTGDPDWQLDTDALVPNQPTVQNETVYAGTVNGTVHAVDVETGERRWQFGTVNQFTTKPTVTDDTVYVGSGDALHAIDTATGDERWTVRFTSTINESVSSPVVTPDESILVVGTTTDLLAFSL